MVEPDADVVAEAIEKLLKDEKLRTRLGHNAYADSKKYTWEKCANTFFEVFEILRQMIKNIRRVHIEKKSI